MQARPTTLAFDDGRLATELVRMSPDELDELDFGVIGFDASDTVRVYNRHESQAAGLGHDRVLERSLFVEVAPCMNNYLVAERFHDARATRTPLDASIDYVLTLRMRPTRCVLRLVAMPDAPLSYVLVRRAAAR